MKLIHERFFINQITSQLPQAHLFRFVQFPAFLPY